MRASTALLGGGRKFLAPRAVWSPAGGWWGSSRAEGEALTPEQEKRNTVIAALVYAAAGAWVWTASTPLEVRA